MNIENVCIGCNGEVMSGSSFMITDQGNICQKCVDNEKKSEKVMFDVCADYSLDKVEEGHTFNLREYTVYKKYFGATLIKFYYHTKYDELHYCLAPPSWQGRIV